MEEFEDRDLSGAVFWGVSLSGARFRDTDLTGSRFFHTFWRDVEIDGEIDSFVVNGVDVTEFVNSRDRWYPLRYRLAPADAKQLRETWAELTREWSDLLGRVGEADPTVVDTSVDGEWSLTSTLRHLVFAMDKWFSWPLLGERSFRPIGLPNTGSQGGDWPGVEMSQDPDFATVLGVRGEQHAGFTRFIENLDVETLPAMVEVPENGSAPALMCLHVVLEEEFEHLRYMIRDLARLGVV